MTKIFIDAGHNYSGFDTGASSNGLREQDVTYCVAQKAGERLMDAGIEVKYSRNTFQENVGNSLSASINGRSRLANDWGADYFISIHCNAAESAAANGTESFVYSLSAGAAAALAGSINRRLAGLGLTDRGVKMRTDLGVLRNTVMPAVVVELGFITNASDAKWLREGQDELADAICRGIFEFTGVGGHWAQKYYDYLISKSMDISERRFDDYVTRGEMFKLIALSTGIKI